MVLLKYNTRESKKKNSKLLDMKKGNATKWLGCMLPILTNMQTNLLFLPKKTLINNKF